MCGIIAVAALASQGKLQNANGTASGDPRRVASKAANGIANEARNGLTKESHKNTSVLPLQNELDRGLELISHRGPDAKGSWISPDDRIGLGFVRLSINDLSDNGNQPFHDPSGAVHAVVNGELYDSDRIREELRQDTGYAFASESDSEIAVALYLRDGIAFLKHLRGEFSVCLYDARSQRLYAVRDRFGIKPLLWTVLGDRLLIASEIKAFLPFGLKPRWDVKSLLDETWLHSKGSILEGVSKVQPAHYLTCGVDGTIEIKRYWEVDYPDKSKVVHMSEQEMIEGVRSRLLEAVRLRLRADVPVGVYLSGGIDSSAVAGIMNHLIEEREKELPPGAEHQELICYSIAFDEDSGMDESAIAERTAKHLGLKLVKKMMSEEELAKRFEEAAWHCEQEVADLNAVGKFALSEAPNDLGHKVVLTGEGADEIFAGYPFFLADALAEPDSAWPHSSFSEETRRALYERIEEETKANLSKRGLAQSGAASSSPLEKIRAITMLTGFTQRIFASWTEAVYGARDPLGAFMKQLDASVQEKMLGNGPTQWHPLHSALYFSNKIMQGFILTVLGDRVEMAHSIEARLPFLDHELVEYAAQIPPSLKVRYSQEGVACEKWILKEAMRPFITDEIYQRTKHMYLAPVKYPVGGPLHQLLERLLTMENVARLGFVDWDKVQPLTHQAFVEKDPAALRTAIVVAQYVVLAERFSIETAKPPPD